MSSKSATINNLKKLFTILLISINFSGCARVIINDPSIKVHWIEKGEAAPFRGILLNDYTYYRIREKLNECRNKSN